MLSEPPGRSADADWERTLVEERITKLLAGSPPGATSEVDFWGAQFDLGLAWVAFPEGLGGLGLGSHWQQVVNDRVARAGGSLRNRDMNVVGIGMAGPTLLRHASLDAQRRLLRPCFTAEEVWCQLFSEPGAGSDLAGIATMAKRRGDGWEVSGQKVWTTLAHVARWGLLLARSDPDVPKHRGLTYFVADMRAPGVEVRPLFEITGEAEFNEVFFDAVSLSDDARLGEVGEGWAVAMTTLMSERVAAGTPAGSPSVPIDRAVATWRVTGRDPARRDRLAQLWIEAEVLRLTQARSAEASRTGAPGPEGSVLKLQWAQVNQAVTSFTIDALGAAGTLYEGGYAFDRPESSSVHSDAPEKAFLRARANSIEGGTSEVMRNVLGERVLQLPSEPRADRTTPWRDVPRS